MNNSIEHSEREKRIQFVKLLYEKYYGNDGDNEESDIFIKQKRGSKRPKNVSQSSKTKEKKVKTPNLVNDEKVQSSEVKRKRGRPPKAKKEENKNGTTSNGRKRRTPDNYGFIK